MAIFLKNLRCNIVRSSTDGLLDLSFSLDSSWESKITNFSLHLIINKNVAKFKIPMYGSLLVNINQRFCNLTDIHSRLMFGQSFASFYQVFQGIISAVLKKNVNVLLVLKGIDKLYDVFMLESFMYFNFNQKFISLSFFINWFFGNNFCRIQSIHLLIDCLITFRKSSCA